MYDPKSEAGGYGAFKNALRQKVTNEAKIDSQSDGDQAVSQPKQIGKEES